MKFPIRHQFSGQVLHLVEVGDRKIEFYAPDLRGCDLGNLDLSYADLSNANLEGSNLVGAKLRGANLRNANLRNVNASYCDFHSADLRETNLCGTLLYPTETIGAKFYGVKFAPDSEAAEYSRNAQEAICRRMRITPRSVAYKKLQRINGWTGEFRDSRPSPEGWHEARMRRHN